MVHTQSRTALGGAQFWYSQPVRNALLALLISFAIVALPISARLQDQPPPAATPGAAPAPTPAPAPMVPGAALPGQQKSILAPPALTVVLDPAHGGSDAGARGATGVVESDIVLDFARAIRQGLQSQGLRVLLTREGNQDPSFDERSSMINGLRNTIFISLHVSSTGPVGTVRAYSYGEVTSPPVVSPTGQAVDGSRASFPRVAPSSRVGLIPWDRAQVSYLGASHHLAELMQIQLAQKFAGSPEIPLLAAVRQLRTIAAPAIAIELSSVAVSGPAQLQQMAPPLADAVTRAIADYQAAIGGVPSAAAQGSGGNAGIGGGTAPGGAH